MIKIYKFKKGENASITLRLGKFVKRFEFTGGNAMGGVTASYQTSNPIEQMVLDNAIKNGYPFKLANVILEDGDAATTTESTVKEEVQTPEKNDVTVVEDAVSINDAYDYLKSIGVPHQSMRSNKAIQEQAAKNGILFPNVKFD